MNDNFDPAPFDKYAEDKQQSLKKNQKTTMLDEAIMETFPASDPVSIAQPAPSEPDAPQIPGTGEAICPDCKGTGKINGRTCETCAGEGKIVQGIGGA